MKNIFKTIQGLFLVSCLSLVSYSAAAQSLEDRIAGIQEKIESIKNNSSMRMNVRLEQVLPAEQSSSKLEVGEYVYLGDKVLFNGSVFNEASIEKCKINQASDNQEILVRTVTTSKRQYHQSGDVNACELLSSAYPSGAFSCKPTFALHLLDMALGSSQAESLKSFNLSAILPTRITSERGTLVDRYEIRVPQSGGGSETVTTIDFTTDKANPLPEFFAVSTFLTETNKSFWNWTLSLKTDKDAPLGYNEYEHITYKIPNDVLETLDIQQFIKNPSKYTEVFSSSKVTITDTPIIGGDVFPEEFSFIIPKGEALIVYDDANPGSAPKHIVSQEDQVFTP